MVRERRFPLRRGTHGEREFQSLRSGKLLGETDLIRITQLGSRLAENQPLLRDLRRQAAARLSFGRRGGCRLAFEKAEETHSASLPEDPARGTGEVCGNCCNLRSVKTALKVACISVLALASVASAADSLDRQAERFVTLALSLGSVHPPEIDGYFGPARLDARTSAAGPTLPAIRSEAQKLRTDIAALADPSARKTKLQSQVDALNGVLEVVGRSHNARLRSRSAGDLRNDSAAAAEHTVLRGLDKRWRSCFPALELWPPGSWLSATSSSCRPTSAKPCFERALNRVSREDAREVAPAQHGTPRNRVDARRRRRLASLRRKLPEHAAPQPRGSRLFVLRDRRGVPRRLSRAPRSVRRDGGSRRHGQARGGRHRRTASLRQCRC